MESSRTILADPKASSWHWPEPRPLNLGCRIFISHSGKDKNFVRHLHDRLVHQLYRRERASVFFDAESLPTAEPISMATILAEARGCELGILVLTEDFFMHTRNPMLELETLTTSNVRLLPLFFRISVEKFKKMKRENVWEEQWKEWLEGDEERLGAWRHALKSLDLYPGLELHWKFGDDELRFIDAIVDKVAQIAPPAVSFSEVGVCGRDRLCKIVNDMYNQCAIKRTSASAGRREDSGNSLDLVGIYGLAGLGKSTVCRCLCDFYSADFRGRVCWLDLGSVPDFSQASSQTYSSNSNFMWRMQHLISKLRIGSRDDYLFWTLSETQNSNRLRHWVKKTDPVFLAIDNVLPDSKSLEEAHFYLGCEFAKGSKIFITSRSGKLLEQVTSEYTRFSAVIERIPKLKFDEARDIFMSEIPNLAQVVNVEDEVIKECVSACVVHMDDDLLHEGDIDDNWYHPLMLKSSAASIRVKDLKSRLRDFVRSATSVHKSDTS